MARNARNGGEPAFRDRCEVFEVECDKRTAQWSWVREWVLTNVGWLLGFERRTRRWERVEGQYGVKPVNVASTCGLGCSQCTTQVLPNPFIKEEIGAQVVTGE